jgi:WD40 repeat protein
MLVRVMRALCPVLLALTFATPASTQALLKEFKAYANAVAIDSTGSRVSYLVGFRRFEQVDLRTGRKRVLHDFHATNSLGTSSNVVVSPTGSWVAGAANRLLTVFDQPSNKLMRVIEDPGHSFDRVVSSPTGNRIAAVGNFAGVMVWDVATGRVVRTLVDRGNRVGSFALAWSPRGEVLAFGSDAYPSAVVVLWDASTGVEIRRLRHGLAPIHSLEFSPDGRLLVARERDGKLAAWTVDSGELAWVTSPADSAMGGKIGFLADGGFVVAGGGVPGGKVTVFDARTGRKRMEWVAHAPPGAVMDVQCASRRPLVVTAGLEGKVRVWDLAALVGIAE